MQFVNSLKMSLLTTHLSNIDEEKTTEIEKNNMLIHIKLCNICGLGRWTVNVKINLEFQ